MDYKYKWFLVKEWCFFYLFHYPSMRVVGTSNRRIWRKFWKWEEGLYLSLMYEYFHRWE